MTSASALVTLLLCGLLGSLGQGVRAVFALKNTVLASNGTPNQQSIFNAAYFFVTMMIGFIAGIIAGIGIGLNGLATLDPANLKVLLGIVASGYAGTDFIENALSNVLPGLAGQQPAQAATQPARAALPAPAPPPPRAFPALGAALKTVAPHVDANVWVPALTAAFSKYDINSNRRAAAAIGQFLVEAGAAFQELAENLNYTHADRIYSVFHGQFPDVASAEPYVGKPQELANKVYANRNGNGDVDSGDGYRFRGRGLIQLTGRTEYTEFATAMSMAPGQASDYCATPEGAAMSGCWYLSANGCLPLADAMAWSSITRKVNGAAMEGNEQRIAYTEAMLKALGG
jgi:predicted chitinase